LPSRIKTAGTGEQISVRQEEGHRKLSQLNEVSPAGFCYFDRSINSESWSAISRIKVDKVVNPFRRPIRILGNEGELERIESLLYRVWQGMKDEVEKDEADAKAIKKRQAGEIRAATKRSESAGSATSASDASPRRGGPRKDPWLDLLHQIPKSKLQ
jgi:hypothetical protein